MRRLRLRIKALELSMNKDNGHIRQYNQQMSHIIHSIKFVLIGASLSFTAGIIIGKRKRFMEVLQTLTSLSSTINRLQNKMRFLSLTRIK